MTDMRAVVVQGGSPEVAEVVGLAGATHVIFDYGASYSDESLATDLAAAAGVGLKVVVAPPLWRIEWVRAATALGAFGVMLPICITWEALTEATLVARETLAVVKGAAMLKLWGQLPASAGMPQTPFTAPDIVLLRQRFGEDTPVIRAQGLSMNGIEPLRLVAMSDNKHLRDVGSAVEASDLALAHMAGIDQSVRAWCRCDNQGLTSVDMATRASDLVQAMRDRLADGKPVVGVALTAPNAQMATAYAAVSDFVAINQEHSSHEHQIAHCVATVWSAGAVPIVVVRSIAPQYVWQAVRAGVGGVEIPNIETPEDVKAVVEAIREAGHWTVWGRRRPPTLLIGHIERLECLNNLRNITNVPGLDVLLIGSWDLSQALGCPGNFQDDRYTEAERYIYAVLNDSAVALGSLVTPQNAADQLAKGARWLLAAWQAGIASELQKWMAET